MLNNQVYSEPQVHSEPNNKLITDHGFSDITEAKNFAEKSKTSRMKKIQPDNDNNNKNEQKKIQNKFTNDRQDLYHVFGINSSTL